MSAPKIKPGNVTATSDPARIAAICRAANGHAEIIGPALGAVVDCSLTGSDRHVPAGDNVKPPGSPSFAGWSRELRDDHAFDLVHLSAGVVRDRVEITGLESLVAGMQELAGHGLDVLVNTSLVVAQPAPLGAPELPPLGASLGGAPAFKRGEFRDVTAAELGELPDTLARLGRDALVISSAQDRLLAVRQGPTDQRATFQPATADWPAMAWFHEVVLSFEPRLLLIDAAALRPLARESTVDTESINTLMKRVEAVLVEHRVAGGLIPGPTTANTTPDALLEAHYAAK